MKTPTLLLIRVVTLLCLWIGFSFHALYAQMRVGQPAGSPDPSAALDVSGGPYANGSTYRGIAPPKVALTQSSVAAPVDKPVTGLLIYNTGKAGDVTPGYYYWEGNKWVRLSTASTGAGRVAAAGDPVPAYTFSEALSIPNASAPNVFMLTEPGQEGLFRYAPVDAPNPSIGYPGDTVMANGRRNINGAVAASGTVIVTTAGKRYKRVVTDGTINVNWFGVNFGDQDPDDGKAIQRAIDYAKTLWHGRGGWYKATILIPEGGYLIKKTIDVTKTHGILIKGGGSRFINTIITGITGGIVFDFTGSDFSGCENLYITSDVAWNSPNVPPIASTIGVQFAFSTGSHVGGNNCIIKNCYIKMADMPTANNGIGTIGLVNCTSEEFAAADCEIIANIGCVFSYKANLSDAGLNYTIKSDYADVRPSLSMGVVNFGGQNTIQSRGKAQPALVLNGTNSFNFHGYLARGEATSGGTNEAAILATYDTKNFNFSGTIESFSQLLRIKNEFQNCTINAVVANQVNNASSFPDGMTRPPIIDVSSAIISGSKISVTFGENEMNNRYFLYDAGQPSNLVFPTSTIVNSEIICSQFPDNNLVVSTNLFSTTDNTVFKTDKPFKVESGISKQLFSNPVSAGTVGTPTTATVARWRTTNNQNLTPGKAGIYSIAVEGTIRAGWYGAGGLAMARFRGTISIAQQYQGGKSISPATITILDQTSTSPVSVKITGVALTIDVAAPNIYKINITPAVTGMNTGEPITISAVCEVSSDFAVKGAILFP